MCVSSRWRHSFSGGVNIGAKLDHAKCAQKRVLQKNIGTIIFYCKKAKMPKT